jgi:ElaB/YqjD/DUF883 family membrane-anchored ribosome-binding protein
VRKVGCGLKDKMQKLSEKAEELRLDLVEAASQKRPKVKQAVESELEETLRAVRVLKEYEKLKSKGIV